MKLKILLCVALALCACACFSSPASRFYMLNSIQETASSATAEADQNSVSICVGPVLLADYLDHKQLCTRDSGNEVLYAEYDRWAEPLDAGIVPGSG